MVMKKILFFAVAAALLVSCGGNNKYSISMTLPDGSFSGDTVYLTNFDTEDTVAMSVVDGSTVAFEGKTDKDFLGSVEVGRMRSIFVVEPGEIMVTEERSSGTRLNEVLDSLGNALTGITTRAQSIVADYSAGKIDSVACQNALDILQTAYLEVFKTTYKNNSGNAVGLLAFLNYAQNAGMELAEMEAEVAGAPALSASKQVGKLLDAMRKEAKTAEGQMFTDFTITNEKGEVQKLSDYVGKGDYVLADFWASWCGPCRAEIPNIKKIYDKYNGKGLTVLGIAVWDKPEDTRKAIEDLQIPWQQITNAGTVPTDLYGINGIPHIILFGPDGKIIARDLRGEEMVAKVAEVMKKK